MATGRDPHADRGIRAQSSRARTHAPAEEALRDRIAQPISPNIQRERVQAKWRLLMELFLRLSEALCLLSRERGTIGRRRPCDPNAHAHSALPFRKMRASAR